MQVRHGPATVTGREAPKSGDLPGIPATSAFEDLRPSRPRDARASGRPRTRGPADRGSFAFSAALFGEHGPDARERKRHESTTVGPSACGGGGGGSARRRASGVREEAARVRRRE
ncbi:hypothetical protein emb_1c0456 [Coriobacteriaceae bacterium EMTCatB1]|nr:hypothetical protein emb_1c0456 [Coriobacteriaceae bacterium EMTCatB1]